MPSASNQTLAEIFFKSMVVLTSGNVCLLTGLWQFYENQKIKEILHTASTRMKP